MSKGQGKSRRVGKRSVRVGQRAGVGNRGKSAGLSPVVVRSLSDLRVDAGNVNRGTERGRAAVAASLELYGAGRGVVIDRDGVIIAGEKTVEAARAAGLGVEVVPTTGETLLVTQRMDLSLAADEGLRARGLSVADNRTGELGLNMDPARLRAARKSGAVGEKFYTDAELRALKGRGASANPRDSRSVSFTVRPRLVKCPDCGCTFDGKEHKVEGGSADDAD